MKLVTPNVDRIPKHTDSVDSVFKKAMAKAFRQEWDRVVIIGQGKRSGHWMHSRMKDEDVIGMIEIAKNCILKDY